MLVLSALSLLSLTSSAHAAWRINPVSLPEVRRLAHVIQMDSSQALQDAQMSTDWNNWEEQRAVNELRSLAEASGLLDRELETSWPDPNQVDNLSIQVSQSANRVQLSETRLRTFAQDQYLFEDIRRSVQELNRIRASAQVGIPGGNIQTIAHALDDSVRDLLLRAQREAGYNQPWKLNAIRNIQTLVYQADHLYRTLLQPCDTNLARSEAAQLSNLVANVRATVSRSGFSVVVLQALNRVNLNVTRLELALGSGPRYVPAPPPGY